MPGSYILLVDKLLASKITIWITNNVSYLNGGLNSIWTKEMWKNFDWQRKFGLSELWFGKLLGFEQIHWFKFGKCCSVATLPFTQFSPSHGIILSTLRRWDKSAAIQELFSFLGIGTKQVWTTLRFEGVTETGVAPKQHQVFWMVLNLIEWTISIFKKKIWYPDKFKFWVSCSHIVNVYFRGTLFGSYRYCHKNYLEKQISFQMLNAPMEQLKRWRKRSSIK